MARWRDFDDYRFFAPSRPRDVKGGIKAQNKRGTFGESWWAKRWIAVLEGFHLGNRLERGRRYARRGQVLSISVEKGMVKAAVQGSRPQPYAITIRIKPLDAAGWKKVAETLAGQAVFAAKLLSGEMPQEIESVFQQARLSLFPASLKDLDTNCSCPDWSNPCKHLAAVYYLLGEEFDRDPFVIFKLRGMTREEFLGLLGEGREGAEAIPQPEPLRVESFWKCGEVPDFGEVRPPEASAALARRLGKFPFWRGAMALVDALEPVYRAAAQRGVSVFLGEKAWSTGSSSESAISRRKG